MSPQKKKAPAPPPPEPVRSVESYKSHLDDLREEYEVATNRGTNPVNEARLIREIGRVQAELKEKHGVDY